MEGYGMDQWRQNSVEFHERCDTREQVARYMNTNACQQVFIGITISLSSPRLKTEGVFYRPLTRR